MRTGFRTKLVVFDDDRQLQVHIDDLEIFTHCKLDPARNLNYFGDEILRSDECHWAEDDEDDFAFVVDPQYSCIYVKD